MKKNSDFLQKEKEIHVALSNNTLERRSCPESTVARPASATARTEEILPRGLLRIGEIDWLGTRGNWSNRIVLQRASRHLERECELRERRGESEQEAEVVAIVVVVAQKTITLLSSLSRAIHLSSEKELRKRKKRIYFLWLRIRAQLSGHEKNK